MLNILRFLLILCSVGVSYCCSVKDFSNDISSDDYYDNAFTYPWLVVIDDITEKFATLYGGLIHPKAVLTSADLLKRHNMNNLIVVTNCDENIEDGTLQNCSTRNVMKIIYPDDNNGQLTPEKSYALLILTTPFNITPTISPVNLINSMELVDKQSCVITHWLRAHDIKRDKYEFVTEAFQIPYVDGNFSIDGMNKDQIIGSSDSIIQASFFLRVDNNIVMYSLAFFGTPIVCYGEDSIPYQVGIANFGIKIPLYNDRFPLRILGSNFLITDYFDEIMKKLQENVS
ncbi:uncharacterized protein [Chelonus insularis]|uniref:uncharacterized protein n=1 Tax=Chelonus insularis TaxID=460826 RepID=UPI00158C6B4D|nr:uncharacterized protein LOC118072677 [Chelonus insularis]